MTPPPPKFSARAGQLAKRVGSARQFSLSPSSTSKLQPFATIKASTSTFPTHNFDSYCITDGTPIINSRSLRKQSDINNRVALSNYPHPPNPRGADRNVLHNHSLVALSFDMTNLIQTLSILSQSSSQPLVQGLLTMILLSWSCSLE